MVSWGLIRCVSVLLLGCNKLPQSRRLRRTQICSPTFWRAQGQCQSHWAEVKVSPCWFLLDTLNGPVPCLFQLLVSILTQDPRSTFRVHPSHLCFHVTWTSPLLSSQRPLLPLHKDPWDDIVLPQLCKVISISRLTSFINICQVPFVISVTLRGLL